MRLLNFFCREEGAMSFATGGMFGGHTSNGLILVVEDEPDVRKVVRMTLTRAGYDVLEAEDGEKAIQVINEGENPLLVDVIITDIRMPKISGVEAIAYFQQQYACVPIIVLTGYPDMEMATGYLKKGIVDYLVKPVEKENLLKSLAQAIERRKLTRL
jgi:two-component system chemotaxis response regulator CheY